MIASALQRRWLPVTGAIVVFALLLVGCSDDTTSPTTTTVATSSTTTADPATTTRATDSPDARSVLTQGLAAIGERYGFTATVEVGGSLATTVTGTVHDGTGSYAIVSGGVQIDYVIAPEGQWARQEGGDWEMISGAAPLADPKESLSAPQSVDFAAEDDGDALLEAVYSGSELGFAEEGDVLVTIVVTRGIVSEISYQTALGDQVARVVTTFDPTADTEPIQVPPG